MRKLQCALTWAAMGATPVPLIAQDFAEPWTLGTSNNDGQAEFSEESEGAQPGPGAADAPINVLAIDEEWSLFERALTSGDPFSRIHFNLDHELIKNTTQIRLHLNYIQLGAVARTDSAHDVVVRVNGNDIFIQADIVENTIINASFLPTSVGAIPGENIIEIERTG